MSPEMVAGMGILRGVIAAVLFAAFISLWLSVYSGRRRAMFERAALLPLEDDIYGPEPARGEVK